eukprot:symbB.v1.2.003592.t1/scaffold202.1/size271277/3
MAHVSIRKRKEGTKALLRHGSEPLQQLQQLREEHLELDLIHYSAASKVSRWPFALHLRQRALELKLNDNEANTLIFDTAIMTAAGRGNAWNVALQLGGKRWDVVALNSVLAVATWAVALALLNYGATRRLQDAVSKNSAQRAFGQNCLKLITADKRFLVNPEETLEEAEIKDGECLTALVVKPQLAATEEAFALCRGDGQIITWGDPDYGSDNFTVRNQLRGVQQIQATEDAFAAILADGSVVTWGRQNHGGNSSAVQDQLRGVQQIQATDRAFAAILDVQQIQATLHAFAAILADGSVITWGESEHGGDSSAVQDPLRGVQQIQATDRAFAAILADGSVITWGDQKHGGDSLAVQDQLRGVQQIQATCWAFAAILSDGSVITWGDADCGGDSDEVSSWCRVLSLLNGSLPSDLVACTCCLSAVGTWRWEKALEILGDLEASSGRANSITFNAALTAVEVAWQNGLQLLCAAKLRNLQRDVVSYSALLGACQKRWREAFLRWSGMVEVGVFPNAVTFTALLSCLDFAQRWQHTLGLLRRHPTLRSPLSLNAALSAVAPSGWRKALQLLMQCRTWQLKIDALGVANVAQAMLPWKHALELLQRSPRKALPGVLRALCAAQRWEEALQLLCRMDEMFVKPEATSLGSLVDALEKTGEAAMLLKLLQRLQDADSTFSSITFFGHLQKKM